MGSRKHIAAAKRKEARKSVAMASLRKHPTSPRKMREVADIIRGVEVERALAILRHSTRSASVPMAKLLRSAIENWEAKNEGMRAGDTKLIVESIMVDESTGLKRMRPRAQGRGHRINKRSNHVTMVVGAAPGQTAENNA